MTKKTFDICGAGSSIVDQQFKVTPEIIKQLKLRPNEMTLATPKDHEHILNVLNTHNCEHISSCGGSVTNSIVAAASLGSQCHQLCCVANDETGDIFLKNLTQNNISYDLSHVQQNNTPTATCIVMVTPDGQRTMSTCLGISSYFDASTINLSSIEHSQYFYVEGYMVTNNFEATKTLLNHAQKNKSNIVLSLSDPWVASTFQSQLRDWCNYGIDLIFCNEAEAIAFTQTNSLTKAKEALKQYCNRYAITCGENGAILFDGNTETTSAGHCVNVIDTNGAGDIFAGTFLHQLSQQQSFETAGNAANLAASKLVQHFGARLPKDTYKTLLNKTN